MTLRKKFFWCIWAMFFGWRFFKCLFCNYGKIDIKLCMYVLPVY